MEQQKVVEFWLQNAQEDWEFAVEIWKSGRRLYNALFFAQMAIEKTLKALHYHKKGDHPLLTHDLGLLARKMELDLSEKMREELAEVTTFNISARYDDYKKVFRQKATSEYTNEWMDKSDKIRGYLLNLFV